jgi:hypothetical protein
MDSDRYIGEPKYSILIKLGVVMAICGTIVFAIVRALIIGY